MPLVDFEFPPLGPTGEGEIVYPPGTTADDWPFGCNRPAYWMPDEYHGYYVTYQLDRPACAFRCHYPGGSSPCDQRTADDFVEWVKNHT